MLEGDDYKEEIKKQGKGVDLGGRAEITMPS